LRDCEVTLELRQGLNLNKSAVKNILTMNESLIQKYYVNEEANLGVKFFRLKKIMTLIRRRSFD